jgi:hypothetical protein
MEITRTKVSYETEQVPSDLTGFKHWLFTSGPSTGQDFKRFSRLFRNWLKKQLSVIGLQIINFSSDHYDLSGFVTNGQDYVYFSVGDVRFNTMGKWYESILVRTAKHEKDYTGGSNNFCSLESLKDTIVYLMA